MKGFQPAAAGQREEPEPPSISLFEGLPIFSALGRVLTVKKSLFASVFH
jgi:hypothetical protein